MKLSVGDIVKVSHPSWVGVHPFLFGYVYELYTDFDDPSEKGASILLENERDLGGFSHKEQQQYLEYMGPSGVSYNFTNVVQLQQDFGIFKMIFEDFKQKG
jgi:hypothetical protein